MDVAHGGIQSRLRSDGVTSWRKSSGTVGL